MKMPNTKCEYCGNEFWRNKAELERNISRCKHVFCSRKCFGKWNKENVYSKPNTVCDYCKKEFHRATSIKKPYKLHFCSNKCQGKWWSTNLVGDKCSNWQGGKTAQRKYELQSTAYRNWRKNLLSNAECIFCNTKETLELHHIEARSVNPNRIRDAKNVISICAKCHDIFHSINSKGSELRERLNTIVYDNPQPIQLNVNINVNWKVQRLTGEDTQTNKPDTSAATERYDIVRACLKEQEAEDKELLR